MARRPVQGNPDGAFVFSGCPALSEARMSPLNGERGPLPRARLVLVLAFALLTVVILPLAAEIHADPTWIMGISDAADYDDDVSVLTDGNPTGKLGPPVAAQPLSAVVTKVTARPSAAVSDMAVHLASRLRGPPISRIMSLLSLAHPRCPRTSLDVEK